MQSYPWYVSWGQVTSSNANGEPSKRLDMQTFTLPTSWSGTALTGMSFDIFGPMLDGFAGNAGLSALNVNSVTRTTAVPEPSELGVFGVGLATIGMLVLFDNRRRRRIAR